MISFGKGYVNAVFGSRKQSVVYGQQDIKGLRGPGKEKRSPPMAISLTSIFLQISKASCQLALNAGMLSLETCMSFSNKRQG